MKLIRDDQNAVRTLGAMFDGEERLRDMLPFYTINYARYLRPSDPIHNRKDSAFYSIFALGSYGFNYIIRQFGIIPILSYAKRVITSHSSFFVSINGIIRRSPDKQMVWVYT